MCNNQVSSFNFSLNKLQQAEKLVCGFCLQTNGSFQLFPVSPLLVGWIFHLSGNGIISFSGRSSFSMFIFRPFHSRVSINSGSSTR